MTLTNLATKCATYSGTKAVGEPGLAAKPLPWVSREGYSGKPLATALGLLGTGEEGKNALVHPTERRLRGDVAAALEELGQGEVGEDLFCPREDSPGGEESVLLGGEHRNRPPKPASSSSVAVRGRSASSRRCRKAAPSCRTAGPKAGSSGSVNRDIAVRSRRSWVGRRR